MLGLCEFGCVLSVWALCVVRCRSRELELVRVLGPYKILPIFYCNKRGRGENILRNIVGNKGGLGGRNCTIMCNNTPFPCRERFFFQTHFDPSEI